MLNWYCSALLVYPLELFSMQGYPHKLGIIHPNITYTGQPFLFSKKLFVTTNYMDSHVEMHHVCITKDNKESSTMALGPCPGTTGKESEWEHDIYVGLVDCSTIFDILTV
jgi:hypothetical protein